MNNSNRLIAYRSGPEGFDTVTYFYEASKEVVAFDAQLSPDIANRAITYLRQFTAKPITWLILTQPSPDKFNGASIYKELGAKILCSTGTAKFLPAIHQHKEFYFTEFTDLFRRKAYPRLTAPDVQYSDSYVLTLSGGEEIYLRSVNRIAAASCHTTSYIPSIDSLIVGDLIHHKAHSWLEGGLKAGDFQLDIDSWIAALNDILNQYSNTTMAYGGRGRPSPLSESIREQIYYLKTAQTLVQNEIAILGSRAKEYHGPNSEEMYKNLTKKFQVQFPDYELPYLIETGSYGLVNRILDSRK